MAFYVPKINAKGDKIQRGHKSKETSFYYLRLLLFKKKIIIFKKGTFEVTSFF